MTKIVYNFAHHLKDSFITDTLTLNISYMKKTLLTAMCLGAAFCMQAQTVLFEDDFEWLDEWAVAAGVGKTVETDDLNATATALTSIKDENETTLFDFIESKGYKFIYDKNDKKRIYLQQNYLKFGKTGNHGGIIIPAISEVPEGHLYFSFDWCPMRQGSGKIDPVNLIVDFTTGDKVTSVEIPTHGWENGHVLEWIHAEVDLANIEFTNSTTITIRQQEWEVGTANRWFLDNIKLTLTESTGISEIAADAEAPVVYYNLQGVRVANPKGLVIRKQGNTVSKVVVK